MTQCAFRLLTCAEFQRFKSTGIFEGSDKDIEAGFIHLSTFDQLGRRIDRYRGEDGHVYALCVDLDLVADDIRWEQAHDGDQYPHLFRPITKEFARKADIESLPATNSA